VAKDELMVGVQDVREFQYTPADFERACKLIYEHAGISLGESKQNMVYCRLSRRVRAQGLTQFKDYLRLLEDNNAEELEEFINALTTNLTSFFREEYHFPLLAEHVKKLKHNKQIRIWCSAASTGEEPYSLAITMIEAFGTLTPPVRILATDLDTKVLATAQEGIYSMERVEKLSSDRLKRFFLKGTGCQEGKFRVRKELRDMITFRKLNLLDESWGLRGPLDVIFCRNVMIYFDKPTQYRILQKFTQLFAHDGLLFSGHSESLHYATDLFKLRGNTIYELAHKPQVRHG